MDKKLEQKKKKLKYMYGDFSHIILFVLSLILFCVGLALKNGVGTLGGLIGIIFWGVMALILRISFAIQELREELHGKHKK